MTKRSILAVLPILLLATAGYAGAAGLSGSAVTATFYCCTAPTPSNAITNTASAIVGPGVEFPVGSLIATSGFSIVQTSIDISDFTIDTLLLSSINASPGTFNGGVYSFTGAPRITGVTIDPLSTFAPVGLSFTDNSISVNNAGLRFTAGSRLVLDVALAPVPEPATAPLLLAGLLPVLVALRRRMRSEA